MIRNTLHMVRLFFQIAFTERPAVASWLGGGAGFLGMTAERAIQWISVGAGLMGILCSAAGFVYTIIRIRQILKKPDSTE